MKRFIDLRGQHTGFRFAWYDTVYDAFEKFAGEQAFDYWEDFESVCPEAEQERYKSLCPEWVFAPEKVCEPYKWVFPEGYNQEYIANACLEGIGVRCSWLEEVIPWEWIDQARRTYNKAINAE